MSIEQLKKFFETFNLHCTLLDGQNKLFFKYNAKNVKHIENKHFKAIITNNHIYPFTNRLNAFNSKEEEEIKTCEYYNVKPKKDKNELFI